MSKKIAAPQPPAGLSKGARQFWEDICELFALEPHDMERLRVACHAMTRAEQARTAIQRDGVAVEDRFGCLRAHPAAAVERDSCKLFLQAVRQMGVDIESAAGGRLPEVTPLKVKKA
jgi:P27 family predicted phage terminase small subunit